MQGHFEITKSSFDVTTRSGSAGRVRRQAAAAVPRELKFRPQSLILEDGLLFSGMMIVATQAFIPERRPSRVILAFSLRSVKS